MKKIALLLGIITLLANISLAQEDKTVTLTVSGQGKTQDEAKQNALRNAIEQAFGTFISSNTEILNDELVKDEIVSVSNGNIQKYEIISEVKIANGGYATSLKATVSVIKLTSFVESKGVVAELKGNLFAFNIHQQLLNESNELKAITEIVKITYDMLDKSFYGTIQPKDPFLQSGDIYTLPYVIEIRANNNINNAIKYFSENMDKLSLTNDEKDNYLKLNKQIIEIILVSPNIPIDGEWGWRSPDKQLASDYCYAPWMSHKSSIYEFHSVYLRNPNSYTVIKEFIWAAMTKVMDFKIEANNLELQIDEMVYNKCGNGRVQMVANGLVPFSSPNMEKGEYILGKFPILLPVARYDFHTCYLHFDYTINRSLAKYLCKRYYTLRAEKQAANVPYDNEYRHPRETYGIIVMHKYVRDGLVYRMEGSSHLKLSDISKISDVKIIF